MQHDKARPAGTKGTALSMAETVDLDDTLGEPDPMTLTAAPDESTETVIVTREHPGRYSGPRRGGKPSNDPVELGRGGIGRVLIAHDAHLGREVAVKELLKKADGPADSRIATNPRESLAAARFLREARLTGQLEHPNIVPVYELGSREDGTLYYTMKVVRGRNLASALEAVRGQGMQARLKYLKHYCDLCDAIAYAHSRGVIHRDIKPENVMVGEFGETVVLDWGLAKPKNAKDLRGDEVAVADAERERREAPTVPLQSAQQRTTDPGQGLAATDDGTLLGTPIYMSPEQAQGDLAAIDERTDVWALGVVLYEMLTGDPPFLAKTAVELLFKIVQGHYPKVAEKAPDAPPELAAIAHKALARNPADRYPDARAMAEEVRAYLTGGRVQAYNYGTWTLLKRWAARHKAALLVASAAVVALIALGVYSYVEIRGERDRAMAAEADAVRAMNSESVARGRAEKAEGEARAARDSAEQLVRYMLSDLKERLEPLGQLALLDGVAGAIDGHYRAAPEREDPNRMRNRAAVTALMGDLRRARGDLGGAASAYDEAEALRAKLLAADASPEHRLDRSESHRQRGILLRMQGDLNAARLELEKARAMRAKLFAETPSALPLRRELVESELDRGDLATLLGDLRSAESAFIAAVELARGMVVLAAETPVAERARFDLSVALDGLGTVRLDMNEVDAAKKAFEEALVLREGLLDKRPSHLEWRHRLAVSHARLGEVAELQQQMDAAQQEWQRATNIMERLVRQDPDNARWARDLAVDLNHLGDLQLRRGDGEAALASFAKALDQMRELAARDPSNAELHRDVEVGDNRIGDAALALGRVAAALTSFETALVMADLLAALDPSNTRWQHDLALTSGKVARARAISGDLAAARAPATHALSLLQGLVAKDPSNAGWNHDLEAARDLIARLDAGGPFDGSPLPDQSQRTRIDSQGQRPGGGSGLAAPEIKRQPQRPDDLIQGADEPARPQPQRPEPAAAPPAKQPAEPEPKP